MAIYGSTFFNCSLDANRETLVFLKNSNPDHKKNLSTGTSLSIYRFAKFLLEMSVELKEPMVIFRWKWIRFFSRKTTETVRSPRLR